MMNFRYGTNPLAATHMLIDEEGAGFLLQVGLTKAKLPQSILLRDIQDIMN
jgi:hypothetical protein